MRSLETETSAQPATDPAAPLCAALERFVSLLEQEREALGRHDASRLAELAARKESLAAELERLSGGWRALGARARAPWAAKLAALARRARALNEGNGRLVAALERHARARLAALGALLAAGYGPDGAARPFLRARALGEG